MPAVLAGAIAYLREASLLLLVLVVVGSYLVALSGAIFSLRRRTGRGQTRREGNARMQQPPHGQEPEGSRERTDNRSVTSHGQMGGQTAWEITNQGPQPRRIYRAAGDALVRKLQEHPPEQFQISWMGDAESSELGAVLRDLLQQGGWQMTMEVSGAMLSGGPPRGVIIETTVDSAAIESFVEWLRSVELNPQVNRGAPRFGILTMNPVPIHIVVGVLSQ